MRNMMFCWVTSRVNEKYVAGRVRFCIPTHLQSPTVAKCFHLVDMSDRQELIRNAVSFLNDPKVIYAICLFIIVSSHRLI